MASESVLFQNLEIGGTRRWDTVLAVPIRVEHSALPEFATAVISVGLPGAAKDYEASAPVWLESLLEIANAWSLRLIANAFPAQPSKLT